MADTKPTPGRKRKESRRGKRLTPAERAEAIELWRQGAATLDELAARFDRDRGTFIRLFNAEGVTKGEAKADVERQVTEAVQSSVATDAAVLAGRVRETKEDHYRMIRGLSKLAWSTIAEAKKNGRPVATVINELKAIQIGTQIFKTSREECFALLGLNDKDDKSNDPMPDLILRELTAEEIQDMTSRKVEDDDLGISAPAADLETDDGSLD